MSSLEAILDEVLTDAYGDDEQLSAFQVAFDDAAVLPVVGRVVGELVRIDRIELDDARCRGLVAICATVAVDGYVVALADIELEPGSPLSELHAAYRHWLGVSARPALAPRVSDPADPDGWSRTKLACFAKRVLAREPGHRLLAALPPPGTGGTVKPEDVARIVDEIVVRSQGEFDGRDFVGGRLDGADQIHTLVEDAHAYVEWTEIDNALALLRATLARVLEVEPGLWLLDGEHDHVVEELRDAIALYEEDEE